MTVPALEHSTTTALLAALQARGGGIALDGEVPAAIWWRALLGPAAHILQRPGKELRARACALGWQLGGGGGAPPAALALAVEALHAGSLIVDDVEDDSDERRGAPALHRVVGTPLAINTGNWMYFWALALLDDAGLDPERHARAVAATVRTLLACHQGQALDLAVSIAEVAAAEVPGLVAATTRLKTGALMALATRLGAIAARASAADEATIAGLGEAVGVGLQMLDDLGSLTSPARLDKGREDLRGGRPTWPWAWLAERADQLTWARLTQRVRANGSDAELDGLAEALRREIEPRGRQAIRDHFDHALAAAHRLGSLDELRADLTRMEESYG